MRQSRVAIDYSDLRDFLSVFYDYEHGTYNPHDWYRDAPREFIIMWEHDIDVNEDGDNESLIDITPLVKLHAHSPTSLIRFECRSLFEYDLPHIECEECYESITRINPDFDELDPEIDPAEALRYGYCCQHEETIGEVLFTLEMEYEYLDALNGFLNNINATWLKSIQETIVDGISVDCTMGEDCGSPTIYIRFHGPEVPLHLQTQNMYQGAVAYLSQMGITNLNQFKGLDFVVAVATGKWVHTRCGDSMAVFNQALIEGAKYVATSTSAGAATQDASPVV